MGCATNTKPCPDTRGGGSRNSKPNPCPHPDGATAAVSNSSYNASSTSRAMARGQATVEFLVYLAILLALIAIFLPPLVRLADSSKWLAEYSTAKSATLKEAYYLSLTKLSGAEYAQPENFTIKAKSVYPGKAGIGAYPSQSGAGAYSA
ncbi:MAG TPA: hypothetical protein PLO51_02955, partial [Candidatus Micrarchaeota archaeon]|nr:hypothetical protein [Candidatus Micrarchaeota archaeon]